MPWTLLANGTLNGLSAANVDTVLGSPWARFYLTGDGHRAPPFGWATKPVVRNHFLALMAQGQLCFHVEEHQEDVSAQSIPQIFGLAYQQKRVFGWELSIFKQLNPLMTLVLEMMGNIDRLPYADVLSLHRHLVRMKSLAWKVGSLAWFAEAVADSEGYCTYWKHVASHELVRNARTDDAYFTFLADYYNKCMELRCGANNFIAANIMASIREFPQATHLITVGDEHLNTNPVQDYLHIPFGLIDKSQD